MSWPYWICRGCSSKLARSTLNQTIRSQKLSLASNNRLFQISPEVRQALSENRPVVALETTIYTHGWPYPENRDLASRLSSLVREYGGVPATIGILNGVARVGLESKELDELVSSAGQPNLMKISRRDFGFALGSRDAQGKPFNGGTTIAGTMILAHMAGIKVFATGGLGGVHRGGETSMDVSADLTELGRTPVAVVSSGCKAFLDLPKTLEYLETHGVAVATFSDGREGEVDFPAFWTRESGTPSPRTVRDEGEAAEIIHAHSLLGLRSGLHFANPIPEPHSLSKDVMEAAIFEAIKHANIAGAVGAAETPYILNKIKDVTGNRSVAANRALVESNVITGTKVAVALAKLEAEETERQNNERSTHITEPGTLNYTADGVSKGVHYAPVAAQQSSTVRNTAESSASIEDSEANVFVAGSLALDLSCDYTIQPSGPATGDAVMKPAIHTSNPAQITSSLGGVGGNVARAAHLMGANIQLCSAVGDDLSGKAALEALNATNMSTTGIKALPSDSGSRTAQYVAVNDSNKDLVMGMADMSILESTAVGPDTIADAFDSLWQPQLKAAKPSYLMLDANWPPSHLTRWLQAGKEIDAHISYEPVSTAKSTRLFDLPKSPNQVEPVLPVFPNAAVHLATPNTHELTSLYHFARENNFFDRTDWWTVIDAFGIPHSGARTQLALATSGQLVDSGIPQQTLQLLPFIPAICTKLGAQGVLLTQLLPAGDERLNSGDYAPYILSRCANGSEESVGVGGVYMRLFPAIEQVSSENVVSVNGVGDTFLGALIAGMAKKGQDSRVEDFIGLAQRAAVLTLKSRESVSPGLGTLRILA